MRRSPRFNLHPEVAGDVTRIWEYIAADSPAAAGRVRQGLLEAFRGIAKFPGQGHRRPDITSAPVRFKVVGNLLIASILRSRQS